MIYHFVNLVGWNEIYDGESVADQYLVDTITMQFAVFVFSGRRIKVNGGSSFLGELSKASNAVVLHSGKGEVPKGSSMDFFEVPRAMEDPKKFASQIGEQIGNDRTVFTGISSPKQNILAREVAAAVDQVDVYCLGAIVDDFLLGRQVPKAVSKFKLEWLYRAINDPKRFISKMQGTVSGFWKIATSSTDRARFRELCQRFVGEID